MKDNNHSSIQAWSMGELFPCVIIRVDTYPEGCTAAECAPEEVRTHWELDAYGRREAYATREDAELVARALNSSETMRAQWRRADPAIREGMAHYAAARAAEITGAAPARSMGGFGDANPARSMRLVK